MLRLRLFYGLLTVVILLWGVGATALILMQDAGTRFNQRLRENYAVIDAAQHFRSMTATINANYLPSLAGSPSNQLPDRALYDRTFPKIREQIDTIRLDSRRDGNWRNGVDALSQATMTYGEGYERFFTAAAQTPEEREELLQFVSTQTQRITDLSENIMTLAEEKLFSGSMELEEAARKNLLFVGTLVGLGTVISLLIYLQLVRYLVDPVVDLQRSIQEIRRGNFELTLPDAGKNSEFGPVVNAFNDMAIELKTRRGEADESLMRANMINRAILESIPSPVFVLGDETNIIQLNPAAEELCEKLGVIGRLPVKIQRILTDCQLKQTHFLPEDPRDALLFRIDEQEYFYLPRIFRFVSDDENRTGWAILLHNVTRIRWLDDMKTNMISTVSHEIKTPLTGIRMVLHLLLEERFNTLDDMQRTMVNSANEDCERLLDTLNNLLDLSRAENGTTHLELSNAPLRDAVQRAADHFSHASTTKRLTIVVESPDEPLPDARFDPQRLDEVLNNLLSNAVKYSPAQGQVTLRITKSGAEYLRVSILDQGPGVPEDSQSRIFERFYRAPGQSSEGIGLGLFISREIMRAHEGRIGLLERADNQTEFYIDVPIA